MSGDDVSAVLAVDLNHLTVGELEELEDFLELSIDEIGEVIQDKTKRKAKFLRALAYIIQKRSNPEFTWEDAAQLKVSFSESDTVPPTDAAG